MKVVFPRIPVFYTLPKIHKSLQNPKGRPIVSCTGSLTENISSFVDHHLKPSVAKLPSFTRDSSDFTLKLKQIGPVSDNDILVTYGVESLYTNIPHQGALEAIEHFLNEQPDTAHPRTNCILELTRLVLQNNNFLFKENFYLQEVGCAMGSKMAPQLANIYMGKFENEFILGPKNPFRDQIRFYKRFIDDIFLVFTGTQQNLSNFHEYLNDCNEHLYFIQNSDYKEINFLDIKVVRENNMLNTNLFRKPTDRNTLLRCDSYHPTPLKRSLPISQFNRVRRMQHRPRL